MPITERSCGQASPSSASTSYLRVRSPVFKIQNDSREFISSLGTRMLGIGTTFVRRPNQAHGGRCSDPQCLRDLAPARTLTPQLAHLLWFDGALRAAHWMLRCLVRGRHALHDRLRRGQSRDAEDSYKEDRTASLSWPRKDFSGWVRPVASVEPAGIHAEHGGNNTGTSAGRK
jgi:hypothetical protein